MKFVLLVYQGSTPLPRSDRWQALPKAEQKATYADSRTVQVRDGKNHVKVRPAEKYW